MLPFEPVFEKHKSVLILGFGREGRSTLRFLKRHYPGVRLGVADRNRNIAREDLPVTCHLGDDYLKHIGEYDLIIKSPGVKVEHIPPRLQDRFTSQTDLFLRAYGRQTIGVTGTKGKSTTVSLLYHLLLKMGRKALLMGNIGLPAFDFIEQIRGDETIVYELSAHQLEMVHSSPHRAVLLNVFPEHLDYFGSFQKYRQAKMNIFRFQKAGDLAFCGRPEELSFPCLSGDGLETQIDGEQLLQTGNLRGIHNLKNVLLALRVLQSFGFSPDALAEALKGFRPLPHRLEYVGRFGKTDFYNDSISTVPQSTVAAVKSIPETDALILGGYDRGLDYRELVDFLLASGVQHFFFLGEAGHRMLKLFQQAQTEKGLWPVADLSAVFGHLRLLPEVKCCMLSPAAASYDQFHNFEHRGDRFKALAAAFHRA